MKIVIIGDGKVGHKLAKQLSEENYDVVMIDHNQGRLQESVNSLDVLCLTGDGVDVETQKEADVQHSDLVIACTSTDELNMLSCLIARRLGAKHTIARVRNPIYFKQIDLLKEDLHLSMTVNPELTVANEISRVLIFPAATKVETFAKGRVELVEFILNEQNPIVGMSLKEIYQKYQIKVLVCAVQRGKEVFIPDGDFVVRSGDKLNIAASHKEIEDFFKALGNRKAKTKNIIICGGGRISYYLAKQLCVLGMHVKIIEKDMEKCERLCEQLSDATIICGNAGDHELLIEEGLESADALVALTGIDEENIIMALFAKQQGVKKIVAKVNEDSRANMVEDMGIDSIVSVKSSTADVIMAYVRARHNSIKSANIETLYYLVGGKVEALEFIVKQETEYTNIPLKDLNMKPNNLIATIVRDRRIIIPGGNDVLMPKDSVIIVTKNKKIQDIRDIFESRGTYES
ncbi:Trk system potassium transporter TrkA [Faecalicatena sp. Marseille-Q4148]|nr:Trk system potassium transporter TrkA [Faecalicatena sp. Marseille-Q4148]